jgi:hypothetical protein
MSEKDKKYVVTGECMLSYPHIAEPQKPKKASDTPKYSAAFVFKPGADISALQAAVLAAAEEKFGLKALEMLKSGALKNPLRRDVGNKGYAEGSVFFNARSQNQPQCVYRHAGPDGKAAVIPQNKIAEDLYAGCNVRVSVKAFYYDQEGNKGVSFALNNIQKLSDGPRIDGRKAATDEFDADLSAPPVDLDAMGL